MQHTNPSGYAEQQAEAPPNTGPATAQPRSGALIGLPRALELVGLGRTAWLDLVKAGTAPAPIKIGRRTLWVEAEVFAFVAECVRRHREGVATAAPRKG